LRDMSPVSELEKNAESASNRNKRANNHPSGTSSKEVISLYY